MVARAPEAAAAHDDAPQVAVRRMLRREGDAAEHLKRAVRDLLRRARRIRLRDRRRTRRVRRLLVERRRRVEDARPRALELDEHVGEDVANRLEAADRPAELAPLGGGLARQREERGGGALGLAGP